MVFIERIKLKNFRKFTDFDTELKNDLNIFVGDNESGKSTLLMALDIVLSGSRSKIETIGLENLFNIKTIGKFLSSEKKYQDLPTMFIELYLNEQNNPDLNGKNNSEDLLCDGIQLLCEPNDHDYSNNINDVLKQDEFSFPFEYYRIEFLKFSGKPYTGYNRPIRHISIDSTQINNEYATREFIKELYNSNVKAVEKNKHQNNYRRYKDNYRNEVLKDLNEKLGKYSFSIKSSGKNNLESDLTICEDGVTIDNKGKGKQCLVKTEFALNKPKRKSNIDILLLEEPENHLSHINMRALIRRIQQTMEKQLFIATHSNLISSRLDLRKCLLLNSSSNKFSQLDLIPNDTAEFFMKAPDNNILEFILSKRVILVEGDAEYILMESFYKNETEENLEESDVHIISVDGTSFKRYLDIAKLLEIRTAVIRDNDGDYQQNCVERYKNYSSENIRIFSDKENDRSTFEKCLFQDNGIICEELFSAGRKTLTVQQYMLNNKAEAALELLKEKADEIVTPNYIWEAIQWIKQ